MTRPLIALFASSCLLAGCATPSASGLPPPAEQPAPARPDPRLCADLPPILGLSGKAALVAPVTPAERDAVGALLDDLAGIVDHDKQMSERAALAKAACP